ncbi:Protein of unknown function [Clostridium amylolyticum]|jgi:Protein of unknown function (DUF3892)|uniref:DUF3892 domain-containing protein n=1 Tax=Clostridium amylolyticum TaxID=1121298 RepID=A0A1M6IB88_9CLOT|nr:DUF3892 domain-containing protein [Clostridium amylolyticum]SHJ31648.1 Protein of unknown function [Clostridium amylolyticum]
MKATKIKMKPGCGTSNNLLEIDSIYLTGCTEDGFYKKSSVHDYVKANPKSIQVNISPYPYLIDAISTNGEKYVKSSSNNTTNDNLLNLPRE